VSPTKRISPPADEKELTALAEIGAIAFGSAVDRVREWLAKMGPEMSRVARRGGEVAGGLVLYSVGQWFGGRCVPMTAVGMVCTAPQHRAGGVASELMRAALQEMHAQGIALSTLYPATLPLYRRVGYEKAGGRYEITLTTAAVGLRDREMKLREVGPKDGPALHQAYLRRMRSECGPLDQQAPDWCRFIAANQVHVPAPWRTYAVWNGRKVEGYIRYQPKRDDKGLRASICIAVTPEAGRRLLTFLADHRTTVETVIWPGMPADPLLLLLPDHCYKVQGGQWMTRLVDVKRALEERGYPAGVEAEVHFRVRDELFPRNRGPFVLEVAQGRGHVRRGGRGTVKLDIRGLAPLYSGHLTATQLAMTPHLEAPEKELAALQPVFAGPLPWMPDAF